MSQGICFYNQYDAPLPLLVVCLHSLERNYDGDIHVVMGDETPKWFIELAKKNDRITISFSSSMNVHDGLKKSQNCWNSKPLIHMELPFDVNLLYDCDSIFVKRFDNSVFDAIKEKRLASLHHTRLQLPERSQARGEARGRAIKKCLGEDIDYLPPINGGCVGSVKGSSNDLLKQWRDDIDRLINSSIRRLRRVPDEYALSLTMVRNGIPVEGREWSYVPLTRNLSDVEQVFPGIMSVHFSNRKYPKSRHFKEAMLMAIKDDYMGLGSLHDKYLSCNTTYASVYKEIA
jgi:hypothetical protein